MSVDITPRPRSFDARPFVRFVGAILLLLIEYAVLAFRYDGSKLGHLKDGAWAEIQNATVLVGVGSAVFTAGLLARGHQLASALREAASATGRLQSRAVLGHVAAFAALSASAHWTFAGGGLESSRPWLVVASFGLSVLATLTTAFWMATGHAWRPIARALVPVVVSGLITGLLAYRIAWWLRPFWPLLVPLTLVPVAQVLNALLGPGQVSLHGAVVGAAGFHAEVAPECSGVEGVIVITVLIVGYWVARRRQLRFPNALWILPLATVTVFTLNVLRIVALLLIGAWVSPEVALGGFHSRAGWLVVCAVALATVWVCERLPFFAHVSWSSQHQRNPVVPYCAPIVASIGLAMVTGLAAYGIDWLYFVHVSVAGLCVIWFRPKLGHLQRAFTPAALANGALVFVLWYALAERGDDEDVRLMLATLFGAPEGWRVAWVVARVAGSVLVVPCVEELAFRGFLQRRLIAQDFESVPYTTLTPVALVGSAIAFGAVHQSFVAGVIAGVAFSLASHRRGNLAEAIVAHATANALIAVSVLGYGQWWLW